MSAKPEAIPTSELKPSRAEVERKTLGWVKDFVIGLNLCPFARPLVASDALRVTVCEATDDESVAVTLLDEIERIQKASEAEIATTLVVLTNALQRFDDYLAFLDGAQQLLEEMDLLGVLQLASFHPDYQFAGEPIEAASHFTNRAPFPMIHVLREDMVTRALETYPNPEQIPERNIQKLEDLGRERLQQMLTALDA
ncbi:MAG: DUF1415 domain-containing protein [Halieaceae bacterium]|jgi:hypothetical protein